MRNVVAASALIGRAHFRRTLFSRRILFCVLIAHLPALAALLGSNVNPNARPTVWAAHLGGILLLQICLPLIALIGGSAVVAEEIDDRTITYLFTRQFPRPALLFGRFVATAILLMAVTASAVFFLLLFASQAKGKGGPIDAHFMRSVYEAALWGVVTYSALFAALGAFFKHPMIIGVAYAFAIEGFLSNLPGKNQALTVQYYLRSMIMEDAHAAWRRVDAFKGTVFATPERAHILLALLVVLVLGFGAWRLARRQFELTS